MANKFLQKYWFLIGLIGLMIAGYGLAHPLAWLAEIAALKWGIVSTTMFLMAWPLALRHLTGSLTRPQAAILACGLNIGLIPLLIWPFAWWAGAELGAGMIVAGATPSTLASAAVLTRRAGGDDSVAILTTILTNLSCFLVMPFWIYVQTGSLVDSAQLTGTIYKLLLFVVLPIGAGQLVRIHRPSADWATARKPLLGTLALLGILSIVFLGSIQMGLRLTASNPNQGVLLGRHLLITLFSVTVIHSFVFWLGLRLSRGLRMERSESIAVGFAGSQKTLMIGLSTAISLGFSMLPILMFHSVQLLLDTVFAERIRDQLVAAAGSDNGEGGNSS